MKILIYLGVAALIRGDLGRRGVEEEAGRAGMDVRAFAEGRQQRLVAGKMRQYPQFDLRIVRRDELFAFWRGEAGAHPASERSAHRDVLEIRVAGRKAARCGGKLVERGPDASVAAHEPGQRFQIGRTQLFQLAEFKERVHHRMVAGEFFQHVLRGGSLPAARFAGNRELQAVEQHVPELLCGTDVERPLRLAVNVLGDAVQILLHFFQKTGERFRVELDARAFHIRKHRDKRQFERLHELDEVRAGQPFEQLGGHGEGEKAGIGRRKPERRAPAGGQLGPAVVAVLRLQQVAGKPEIEPFFRRDASPVRVRVQQRLDVRRDHELRLEQAVHELGRQAGIDDFLIPDGDGEFAVPAEHRHGVAFQRVEEGIGGVAEALARFGLGRVEQGKLAHGAAFSGIHRFRSVVLHGHASVADERGEFALKRAELEFAEQGAASCRFTGRTRMASSVREAQRLVSSVVSWRYRNMASSWPSNFFCRAGFMEAKPSRMASSEAYSWNSFSAVFGPTPRTPGMLSLESPMIACTSGHCVGLRPVSSSKLLRVTIFSSLLAGSHIMTLSCRHCLRSLSVATRITGRSSR